MVILRVDAFDNPVCEMPHVDMLRLALRQPTDESTMLVMGQDGDAPIVMSRINHPY